MGEQCPVSKTNLHQVEASTRVLIGKVVQVTGCFRLKGWIGLTTEMYSPVVQHTLYVRSRETFLSFTVCRVFGKLSVHSISV
jgi:hypothetical protein